MNSVRKGRLVQGSNNCSKTVDDIKSEISMPELLQRYGIKIRRNMCRCPFHGKDTHPSMRVYPDAVHCFTCQYHGDIFDFYQKMEQCDFKTAFLALGGAYLHEHDKISIEIQKRKFERNRAEKAAKEKAEFQFFKELLSAIEMCRLADEACESYSDEWCYLINARDWLNWCYELKYIEKKEVNEVDVIRICREVRRNFFAV